MSARSALPAQAAAGAAGADGRDVAGQGVEPPSVPTTEVQTRQDGGRLRESRWVCTCGARGAWRWRQGGDRVARTLADEHLRRKHPVALERDVVETVSYEAVTVAAGALVIRRPSLDQVKEFVASTANPPAVRYQKRTCWVEPVR